VMSTVLFIDSVHPILEEDLDKSGFHCVLNETDDLACLSNLYPNTIGLVVRSRWVIDQKVILAFPQLKWIARSGSGLENIDLEYCKQTGITVFSSPEGNADAVGEHVLAMCLGMTRKILSAHNSVTRHEWLRELHRGIELKGKTFAIIGLGHMGKAVAQRLASFGCRVIANDIGLEKSPMEHVQLVEMNEVFEEADFVSIHLPLSPANKHYADAQFFSSFKKPIYFINTARGQHCATGDLLNALNNQSVIAAALDVLEFESTQLKVESENHPDFLSLLEHPSVILTPHIAGWTVESYYKLSKVLSNKILERFPQP
jgi:D-3-phosphoglycerate dehydrogenase